MPIRRSRGSGPLQIKQKNRVIRPRTSRTSRTSKNSKNKPDGGVNVAPFKFVPTKRKSKAKRRKPKSHTI